MRNQIHLRREKLLHLLQADTFASVESLSERLSVSPLTVRRDLDVLQEMGQVERMHGGARMVAAAMDKSEISFLTRQEIQIVEKRAIARRAAQLLQRDDVIVVDASTSGTCFVEAIPEDLSLTLITYSAYLPVQMAGRTNLEIISTGGILYRKSLCYLGDDAEQTLSRFHGRRAFLGVKGIALQAGCTDALLPEVHLKSLLVRHVDELVILADHTKLGNVGLSAFASLSQVSTLVTDEGADPLLVEGLRDQGINVFIAALDAGA